MFNTSALRRKAARSKEVLVRGLGSTKKLTIVLPRSAGTFLISREPTVLNAAAVSRIVSISLRSNSRMPSRSFRCQVAGPGTLPAAGADEVLTDFLLARSRVRNQRFQGEPSRVLLWMSAGSCRCNPGESAVRDAPGPEEPQTGCAPGARTN